MPMMKGVVGANGRRGSGNVARGVLCNGNNIHFVDEETGAEAAREDGDEVPPEAALLLRKRSVCNAKVTVHTYARCTTHITYLEMGNSGLLRFSGPERGNGNRPGWLALLL